MRNEQHQDLDKSILLFGDALKLRGKQPATIESYRRDASRFVEYLSENKINTGEVSPDIMVAYQDYLRNECNERENTIRRAVIGIRQFYRYLSDKNKTGSSPLDAVAIPPRDESFSKVLDEEEAEDILAVAAAGKPAPKAARDVALVTLLALEGIKATEAIGLSWHDLLDSGLGDRVTIRIGGARERAITLEPRTTEAIRFWRKMFQEHLKLGLGQRDQGRMFISFKGRDAGTLVPELTRHGLKFIMYELGEKSGINHLNTESLRHYAVSRQLASGRMPEDIMRHLGLRRLGNISKHMGSKN